MSFYFISIILFVIILSDILLLVCLFNHFHFFLIYLCMHWSHFYICKTFVTVFDSRRIIL